MPYSYQRYTYTGEQPQTFNATFSLGYLEEADVLVYVDGEEDGEGNQLYRNFTWVDEDTIEVTDPLDNPSTVWITRTVDKDQLEIDLGNNGAVTRVTLVRAFKQLMMNIHELLDGRIEEFTDVDGLTELLALANQAIADAEVTLAAVQNAESGVAADAAAAAASAAAAAASALAAAEAAADAISAGGVPEAPEDGQQYARIDAGWAVVEGGGGDVEEAPEDGTPYARQDAEWVPAATGGGDVEEAPEDGTPYVRQDADWASLGLTTTGLQETVEITDYDLSVTSVPFGHGFVSSNPVHSVDILFFDGNASAVYTVALSTDGGVSPAAGNSGNWISMRMQGNSSSTQFEDFDGAIIGSGYTGVGGILAMWGLLDNGQPIARTVSGEGSLSRIFDLRYAGPPLSGINGLYLDGGWNNTGTVRIIERSFSLPANVVVPGSNNPVNFEYRTETSTDYTLTANDVNKWIKMANGGIVRFPSGVFAENEEVIIEQSGPTQVQFLPIDPGNFTLNIPGDLEYSEDQFLPCLFKFSSGIIATGYGRFGSAP